MRRVLVVVFAVAALVAAFTWGLYRGIDMGIEEYSRLRPIVIPVPCPAPKEPAWTA